MNFCDKAARSRAQQTLAEANQICFRMTPPPRYSCAWTSQNGAGGLQARVTSRIDAGLPIQCRSLRSQKGWQETQWLVEHTLAKHQTWDKVRASALQMLLIEEFTGCRPESRYPPFRKHCAREKIIEDLFSEGLREIVTIDCVKKLLGNCFQGNCAFLLSLSDFLLFL